MAQNTNRKPSAPQIAAPATGTEITIQGVEAPAVPIPAETFLSVPHRFIVGALSVASKEESRPYLGGVHICRKGESIRIQATDGHRAFIWQSKPLAKADLPAWLNADGIILAAPGLAPRLSLLRASASKEDRETFHVRLGFAKNARFVTLTDDTGGRDTFACALVNGTFPNIDAVIPGEAFGDRTLEAGTATAFDAKYIKAAGAMATTIGASGMQLFIQEDNGPTVATFPGQDGAILILMPLRGTPIAISADTAALMPQAMKGTLAALRAHATRTQEALAAPDLDPGQKGPLATKLASFNERIAAIVAGTTPALPAPDAKKAKAAAAKLARAEKLAQAKADKEAKAAAHAAAKAAAAERKSLAQQGKPPRFIRSAKAAAAKTETVN